MTEPIDEFFVDRAEALRPVGDMPASGADDVDPAVLLALFDAQAESRHIDLAARWLHAQGRGYYTIASAGHEANAAIAMATRVDDPALLHYRSGGFLRRRGPPGISRRRAVLGTRPTSTRSATSSSDSWRPPTSRCRAAATRCSATPS